MATVAPSASLAKLGTHAEHPAYDLVSVDTVDEYGAVCGLYRHKKTGAEVLSVIADEPNKVFGIVFRTPPSDSTGVPHILEHSVLCGSRKYPTKDPFVELLKGSLQTFLNAFTYPDRTCYPVASQNLKDFYNLINVYLDAVLHPRAINDPAVLEQEGWHLELDDTERPLTYKGVVYNEMKGVYSSPDALMMRRTQQELFPDNTYGVDSGGTPEIIPELTFEKFRDFHGAFYHPTNARVFFYGDDPPAARLDLLDEYLREFEANPKDSTIKVQKLRTEPWTVEERFPATPETADKHMVAVNWVLHDEALPLKDQLALGVLDHLLLGTSASALAKALTESNLGDDLVGGGLQDELLQNTFGIGLKGVKGVDADKVEPLILDVLRKTAAEGFDAEAVTASINTIEFGLREFNTGGFPRGLSFMLGAMSEWLYDRSPLDALRFEKPLAELKASLDKGEPVFESLIQKYLVGNGHRVTVKMVPDLGLEAEQQAAEEDRLAKIKAAMSADDLAQVVRATEALKKRQAQPDSPEDVAKLPRLSLADIERENREIPISVDEREPMAPGARAPTLVTHAIPSSGIVYADVCFDASALTLEDAPLLPLLTSCFLETGTTAKDRVALSQEIGTHTGGIRTATLLAQPSEAGGVVTEADKLFAYVCVRGKAVAEKAPRLFELMRQVASDANLDDQRRIVEMLKESVAGFRAQIPAAGHTFADARLRARYSAAGFLGDLTGGVAAYEETKKLLELAEKDWPALSQRLKTLRAKLVSADGLVINLTGDESTLATATPVAEQMLADLPASRPAADGGILWAQAPIAEAKVNEGLVVPTQVNYVAKGGQLYKPGEKVSGTASVVSRYLRTGYLWDTVRVMGGAYGGFCRFSPQNGLFTYLSYRDPNLVGTLDNYDGAADHLRSLELSQSELEGAIIGTVGDLDRPMQPDTKGFMSLQQWLAGETAEDRQARRDELLATTLKDFREFGDRLAELNKSGTVCVVGSKAAIQKASEGDSKHPKLTVVDLM